MIIYILFNFLGHKMLYYLKIFLILTTIFFQKQVYAVENGIYTGVWKIIYSHAASDNTKGDSGIFEFTIKDNTKMFMIIDFFDNCIV